MTRRLLIETSQQAQVLEEILADDEAQLQELLRAQPQLLPVDEFGLAGPMMVVGRESSLASGAVDLVGLAPSGALVIVELKTGPQNSDFRHALAQLLDYGAALWQLDVEQFDASVGRRYFTGPHCPADAPCRGAQSVTEAAERTWGQVAPGFRSTLEQQLTTGSFTYVLVAQRFTPTMTTTIDYLNATARLSGFYAVEVVRFVGEGLSAFEARTVRGPQPVSPSVSSANEDQLLDAVDDDAYREALRDLLQLARSLRARLEWGSAGVSIRVAVPDRSEPVTLGWLFPPGRSGWLGLTDLTLGFDRTSLDENSPTLPALQRFVSTVGTIEGVESVKTNLLEAWRVPPQVLVARPQEVTEALASVFEDIATLT